MRIKNLNKKKKHNTELQRLTKSEKCCINYLYICVCVCMRATTYFFHKEDIYQITKYYTKYFVLTDRDIFLKC